jgi:hypothetical protein
MSWNKDSKGKWVWTEDGKGNPAKSGDNTTPKDQFSVDLSGLLGGSSGTSISSVDLAGSEFNVMGLGLKFPEGVVQTKVNGTQLYNALVKASTDSPGTWLPIKYALAQSNFYTSTPNFVPGWQSADKTAVESFLNTLVHKNSDLGTGHPQSDNILNKHKKLAKDTQYHKKSDKEAKQHFADNMQTLHNDIKSAHSVKEEVEQIDEKVLSTEFQSVNGKHVVNSQTHTHPDDKHYNTNTLIHKGNIKIEGGARKKFEVHNHINRGLTFMTDHSDEEKQAIKKHLVKNKMAGKGTDITD